MNEGGAGKQETQGGGGGGEKKADRKVWESYTLNVLNVALRSVWGQTVTERGSRTRGIEEVDCGNTWKRRQSRSN